jgi:hypothetical protein
LLLRTSFVVNTLLGDESRWGVMRPFRCWLVRPTYS